MRARLGAHGAEPSKVKDMAGKAGGVGMLLFARVNPDTPGKLVNHAYSYEHMELAAYELLSRVAERAVMRSGIRRLDAGRSACESRRHACVRPGGFDVALGSNGGTHVEPGLRQGVVRFPARNMRIRL